MYRSLCESFQLLVFSTRVRTLLNSKTQLGFLHSNDASILIARKPFSSSSLEHSFTVSYLMNSCGLSLENAISCSKKVHFDNPEKPDSVLMLLKNYGFTNTHIIKMVRIHPAVLVSDSEKTLLPKFEFLNSIGISGTDLVKFVTSTSILGRSLENRLHPWYDFLKHIFSDEEKVARAFKRLALFSSPDLQKNLAPNMAFLRKLGVPESAVSRTLTCSATVVLQPRHKFDKIAKEIIKMGFHPQKSHFMKAMHAFSALSKATREYKMAVYKKRWGWSENEIELALKKYPPFLMFSEIKIMKTMDFLVNKMGYQSAEIARHPYLLSFDLENRTIPRCLVMKALLLKGLLKREFRLGYLLVISEKQFLEKFVTRYHEEIPQLLDIYQGRMSLSELFKLNSLLNIQMTFSPELQTYLPYIGQGAATSKAMNFVEETHSFFFFNLIFWSSADVDSISRAAQGFSCLIRRIQICRNFPILMNLSETKVASAMELLVKKVGMESAVIARNPAILQLFSDLVIEVLMLKCLIKKNLHLCCLLITEKAFLDKFVIKYEEDVPELLSVYQGKVRIQL